MSFDPCKQKINFILLRCGEHLFPGEKNISALILKTSILLGTTPEKLTTENGDRSPSPRQTGPFFLCPKCKEKKLTITELCSTCPEAQGGKFKVKLYCTACGHEQFSEQQTVQLLTTLGYDFKLQTKASLGIKPPIPKEK